ncbi:putative RNA-directed DNA polymerase [Tanacetum coccineum]
MGDATVLEFKEENTSRPSFSSTHFSHCSHEDVHLFDKPFTSSKIKDAVWDCGGEKAPGPDGFTFKFIKKNWYLRENDIIPYVKHFESPGHIPRGCNSSFITLVPKFDGPIVLGDFRPISLIGCQYKIIAKVLANRLMHVLPSVVGEQMGFSAKWRNWIYSCLSSAFASILVNGSPTNEFKLERGLRQGDLLSPFLFILAVEELNIALLEATNNNIFHGVKVDNARNLSRIFTCFHLASGLKANFNKSKLFGIGVNTIELNSLASTIGCQASQFPCMYLGLPVGAKMSRCLNWSPLVERFQKRLSKWKSKNLSFCGRLTLIRSVLDSLGVYYFSTFKAPKKTINKLECIRRKFFWGRNLVENKITWIARKKVISPINHGGLGIGSLKSSNQAMLSKWWWRFGTDGNSLWWNIIRSIHEPSRVSMSLVSKVNTRSMVPYYKAKR